MKFLSFGFYLDLHFGNVPGDWLSDCHIDIRAHLSQLKAFLVSREFVPHA
jgi:hypothetical protein